MSCHILSCLVISCLVLSCLVPPYHISLFIAAGFSATQTRRTKRSKLLRCSDLGCPCPTSSGPACCHIWGTAAARPPPAATPALRHYSASAVASSPAAPRSNSLAGCCQRRWRMPRKLQQRQPTHRARDNRTAATAHAIGHRSQPANSYVTRNNSQSHATAYHVAVHRDRLAAC
jgi:hypothetical protein